MEEILNTIREMIPGCFGQANLLFALHPTDEERAESLREFARENGVEPNAVIKLFSDYILDEKKVVGAQYAEEMREIRDFFEEEKNIKNS